MVTVYKVLSHEGKFAAFWQNRDDEISFFSPSNYLDQKSFIKPMAEWNSLRASYALSDTGLDSFPEIVNAAWHFLALTSIYIDKTKVEVSELSPGIYYPRIWRGNVGQLYGLSSYNAVNPTEVYGNKHIQSVIAASSLFDYLIDIFRNIEPVQENFQTYGHKIRECFILACTEIETGWRAVLDENTPVSNRKDRYTTVDYFSVKKPLNLEKWTVALKDYPDLGTFSPFVDWSAGSPTTSLKWYDDYNAVKHHREIEFSKATLGNLLNAMAALHIMQTAQWGPEVYSFFYDNRFSPFNISQCPSFPAAELYMPSIDGEGIITAGQYFKV